MHNCAIIHPLDLERETATHEMVQTHHAVTLDLLPGWGLTRGLV